MDETTQIKDPLAKNDEDEDEEVEELVNDDKEDAMDSSNNPGPSMLDLHPSETSLPPENRQLNASASGSTTVGQLYNYPLNLSATRLMEVLYVPDPSLEMERIRAERDATWLHRSVTYEQYNSIKNLKKLAYKTKRTKDRVHVLVNEWVGFQVSI